MNHSIGAKKKEVYKCQQSYKLRDIDRHRYIYVSKNSYLNMTQELI